MKRTRWSKAAGLGVLWLLPFCAVPAGGGVGAAALAAGHEAYMVNCQGCHRAQGQGKPARGIPDLRGTLAYFASFPAGRAYLLEVPGVADSGLSPAVKANVLNWMLATLATGNTAQDKPFTVAEISGYAGRRLDLPGQVRAKLLSRRPARE